MPGFLKDTTSNIKFIVTLDCKWKYKDKAPLLWRHGVIALWLTTTMHISYSNMVESNWLGCHRERAYQVVRAVV